MTTRQSMELLFSPFTLMGFSIRNRFIRSATMEGMALNDGSPSPDLIELYRRLALGGVGLISTSVCLSDRTWMPSSEGVLFLDSDDALLIWEKMVKEVHRAGTKISLQLGPFFYYQGRSVGPSAYREGVHALTRKEIEDLTSTMAKAAARAQKIGFDAIQVHAGHGYPISQFISPFYNKREDEYGGIPENKARILTEIYQAIIDKTSKDYPVWIKMNTLDGQPGGLTPEVAEQYGPILEKAGYAAIEVTGGSPGGTHDSRGPIQKEEWFEGFYLNSAALIKAKTNLPVSAVGGIRKLEMIDHVFSSHTADLISLSRPLIREPDLIDRWMSGNHSPAACISCNGCTMMMRRRKGLFCVQEKG